MYKLQMRMSKRRDINVLLKEIQWKEGHRCLWRKGWGDGLCSH